jgi:hypothetical protein
MDMTCAEYAASMKANSSSESELDATFKAFLSKEGGKHQTCPKCKSSCQLQESCCKFAYVLEKRREGKGREGKGRDARGVVWWECW